MSGQSVVGVLLVVLVAGSISVGVYAWLDRLGRAAIVPAALRTLAITALGLLLLDLSCARPPTSVRPLVLLDASLSMAATGGRWAQARAEAVRLGEVRLIGPLASDSSPAGGRSLVTGPMVAAAALGRPAWLITDGEVEDASDVPADIAGQFGVKLFPRQSGPDLALTRVAGPARVTVGDTLHFEVDVTGFAMPDRREIVVDVADGATRWLSGPVRLAAGNGSATLDGPLPARVGPGDHLLTVSLRGAADREPRTDVRLHQITVVPTPGVVVIAAPASWESRFFFRTIGEVAALPVRGYLMADGTRWARMGDLAAASTAEVEQAAGRADLLVTFGDPPSRLTMGRARSRWEWVATSKSSPPAEGDWYLTPGGQSPVAGALLGLPVDSFPPAVGIAALSPGSGEWVGLGAQLNRRGLERPAMIGRDSAGKRQVLVGTAGLWRWAFRGGTAEQAYRALVAATTTWLLGGADSSTGVARPVRAVAERGRPLVFERLRPGLEKTAIETRGGSGTRIDTLRFDGQGRAELQLEPGSYQYRLAAGGAGLVGVEEYSAEWLPRPVTLSDRLPSGAAPSGREPLRDKVWLFALAILAWSGEWWWRRRSGLR